jgi:hypothetical protein
MRAHRLPILLGAVAVVSLSVAAMPAVGHNFKERFRVDLDPVNAVGADGRVDLELKGETLHVRLDARGLDDGIHLAHIHGIRQAENECPDLATADTDGNGLVDIGEGLPAYGPVQRTLSNGLSDVGTRIKYRRAFVSLDNGDSISALGDLSQYAIVVHGVDLDGDGVVDNPDALGDGANNADNEITMPALCGTIEPH